MVQLTLPVDSEERKNIPLRGGCYNYFPAALMGVAQWSKRGNDKHNKGQPLHHARGKSMDHEECIERHGGDLADLQAALDRYTVPREGTTADEYMAGRQAIIKAMLDEYDARAWRSLAASQEFREKHGLAPLAPAARLPPNEAFADAVMAHYGALAGCAEARPYHGNDPNTGVYRTPADRLGVVCQSAPAYAFQSEGGQSSAVGGQRSAVGVEIRAGGRHELRRQANFRSLRPDASIPMDGGALEVGDQIEERYIDRFS